MNITTAQIDGIKTFSSSKQSAAAGKMETQKNTAKYADLIYDVGMHQGQDTDHYLKRGYRVVGFEAAPENAAFCRERFADAIKSGRLTLIEGAISEQPSANDNPATVKFFRNKDHSLWGSTCDDWAYRNEVMGTSNELIEVPVTNFAEAMAEYGVPFYMKADIVGSETICLRAMQQFINKPDYLSIRSEKVIFRRLEDEFDLLEELGYNRFQAIQQDVHDLKTSFESATGAQIEHQFEEGASGIFGEHLSGEWKNREAVLKEYRKIFTLYWLFGDYSYLIQTEKGKRMIAHLERIFRRPLPGWYDTHAKHSSVK